MEDSVKVRCTVVKELQHWLSAFLLFCWVEILPNGQHISNIYRMMSYIKGPLRTVNRLLHCGNAVNVTKCP